MRTIPLHPASILLGVVLASVTMLIALPAFGRDHGVPRERTPTTADMVEILAGKPYTVPEGVTFVLTGIAQPHGSYGFTVDGKSRLYFSASGAPSYEPPPPIVSVPWGITARAGSVLAVDPPKGNGRAWGYLERGN